MQRIQEVSLIVGVLLFVAAIYPFELGLPYAPWVYITLSIFAFAVSTIAALIRVVGPRSTPLSARAVAGHFVASAGLGYITMGAYNVLRVNMSYPLRFAWFLAVVCVLFVVPWVITEFRILHRTPLAFDASLPPFLAGALYQLGAHHSRFELFWDSSFWLFLGIPTSVATYYVMRRRVRAGRGTMRPLCISTAILYLVLGLTYATVA